MINTNMIKNIKEIEKMKIDLLENVTNIFKGTEDDSFDLKIALKENIDITKKIAERLNIDLEK